MSWDDLKVAIESNGSLEEIAGLLDSGAPICSPENSEHALSLATSRRRKDIVSLLLDRETDINAVLCVLGTALNAAVYYDHLELVSLLLDRGADVNLVHHGYETALTTAAQRERTDTALLLLDRGADVNLADGRCRTALFAAIYAEENTDIISLLLDRGADVNQVGTHPTEFGRTTESTALAAAALKGRNKTVSLLLDRGANINLVVGGDYGTALIAAAYGQSIETTSLLLDRGADINLIGGEYGSALAAAACHWDDRPMCLLLKRGANIGLVGGRYGSALAAAAFRGARNNVSLLINLKADINLVGGEFGTALAAAASAGSAKSARQLLDIGAGINQMGGKYGTALAAAAAASHLKTKHVSLLLDRGAEVNAVGGRYGPALTVAALEGSIDAVSLLLDHGANINAIGGDYVTALGAAVAERRKDVVSLLVDRGADVNLVCSEFGTILGQAIYKGNTEGALLLLEHGADVLRVGGSYSTASGVYPSALDVAHSEGVSADPVLLARLQAAASHQNGPMNQQTDSNEDLVDSVISLPPFPMPYSALCTNHYKGELSSSSSILSTEIRAGGSITTYLAEIPCKELNEEAVCHTLAVLVGLREDTIEAKRQWIRNDVRYFVACNYDFGLAFAAARCAWKHFNDRSVDCGVISMQRSQWHKNAQVLDEARLKAIKVDLDNSSSGQARQELIVSPYSIMPRRIWDLKSDRVVDFRMLHATQSTPENTPMFWAVSHSWTSDMSPERTPINQHQWPVPLPKTTSLVSLRYELFSIGAEYVWLDVLCLRQQCEVGGHLEKLRQEEWKLDVPTIGNIYRAARNIVRYFNGLGVPFSTNGWDDPRHWFQRAWTLQGIATEHTTINAGIPRDRGKVFLNSRGKVSGKAVKLRSALRPVIELAAQVDSKYGCEVYELVREMARRYASQPLDKLSGLFYLLRTTKLPCYDERKTSEGFWRECFHLLPTERKAEILLSFPYRGSDQQWFPTWAQMLDWPMRDPECNHMRSQSSLD